MSAQSQKRVAAEAAVDESSPFMLVDKLQEHGVNVSDIAKLKQAGCYTIENLTFRTKKDICEIKGISEAKYEKIVEAAKKLSAMGSLHIVC
jgi:meiotic recombination protein DMC1